MQFIARSGLSSSVRLGLRPRLSFHLRGLSGSNTCIDTARRIGQTSVPVDDDCIPIEPPYSVTSLLDSLPSPQISDAQFIHLHDLAALVPPIAGTDEFANKKQDFQQLIRLVDGVRVPSANPHHTSDEAFPDGRIWPEAEGISLDWDRDVQEILQSEESQRDGRKLLELAEKKHLAGFYTVPRIQRGNVE